MSENVSVENIVRNALAESKRLEKAEAMRDENAKLKAASAAKTGDAEKEEVETFDCPECGGKVTGLQKHCSGCGIALEWEE